MDSMFDCSVNILIVFDDTMDEATQDKRISQLFTRARHDNLLVSYPPQNIFTKTREKSA